MNLPEERTVYLEKDNISVNTTSNNPTEVEYLTALQRFNQKRDNYFSMKPIEQTRTEIAQNAVREQQNSLLGQIPRGAAGAAVSGVQTLGRLGVGAIVQAINDTRYAWERTKLTDKYTWGSVNIKRENYQTGEEYEAAKTKYYNDLNAQSRQLEAMHQNVDRFAREQMQEMKERHENWLRHAGLAKEETDGFLYDLSSGGASLLMAIGTAAITKSPAATAAVFGAIQGRQSYEEALANGVSPEKAEKIGLGAGAAEAILEKVGLDFFLRGLKARGWGAKLVRNFLTESIQEGSQGAANAIIMQKWGGKEASIRQILEEVAYQALLGGLTGAGATGAHISVEAAVRRVLPQTAAAAQGISTQEGEKLPPPTLEQVQELVRANEGRELTLQERYGVILANGQAKLEALGVPKETAQQMLAGVILKAGSRESLEDVQQMLNDENNPATYKNGDILESAKEFAEAVRGTQKQLTPEYQKQVYDIRDDVRERALEVGYTKDEAEAAANMHEAFAQIAYQVSGETPRAWYEKNQVQFKDQRMHEEDTSFNFGNNVDYDIDRDGLPDDGPNVVFQAAAAMYQNPSQSLVEFVDFYKANKENPTEQSKSYYRLQAQSGAAVDVPFNRVKHIDNRHHLTPQQWAALEAGLDNVEYAYYIPGQKGENNGVPVFIKANTEQGKAGATLEILPNGRILLNTAFFDSDANIDNWAKNEPLQRPSSKKPVLVGSGTHNIADIAENFKAQNETLRQGEENPLGQTEFTDTGAVITLLEGANKTTLLHELGHVFLRDFERLAAENDNAATRHYTQVIESFLGKKEGNRWNRQQQEKFARTFLEYVRTKDVPEAPQMRTVYDRFKDWLQEIYEAIDGTRFFEKNVSQEAKDFFNEVLAPQAVQVPDAAKFKGKIRQIRQAVEDIKNNRLPRAETGLALDDIKALYNQTKRRIPKAPQTDLLRELRHRGANYKQSGRIDAEAFKNARIPNKPEGIGDDPARWLMDNGYMGESYGKTYEAQDALDQQAYDLIQAALDGKKVYRLADQAAATQRENWKEELEIIKEVSDNMEGAQEVLRKINEIERKGYRVLDKEDVRMLEEKLKATEKLADTELDKLNDLKKEIVDEIKKRVDADQLEAYLQRISAAKNKEALEAAVRRTMLAIEKAYVNRTLQMLNLLQNPRTKATLKEIQTAWRAPDSEEQRADEIMRKRGNPFKDWWKDAFVSMSDRLRRVDKQLARKIEDLPRKRVMRNSRYRQYFGDYIAYIYKYVAKNPEDFEILSWAQMNRNDRAEAEIAAKYKDVKLNGKNLAQLIEEKNEGLKKIWEEGVNHGLSIGWLEAYNPRRMANTDAFIEFLQGTPEWSNIDRVLKIMGVENGTTAEKAMAINKYFRGFEPKDLAAAQPGNIKHRDIMYVSKALSKFYKSSYEALMDYADEMAKAISIKEVFGIGEDNLDDSVGKLVLEAKQRYRLSYREEQLLKDIITAFVHPTKAGQVINAMKSTGYLLSITSPISTVSQLEDLGFAAAQWGHANVASAVSKKGTGGWIKLEQIGAELYDVDMRKTMEGFMDKGLRKLLGVNGFTAMDRLGKETYINADFQARQKQAQKSPQKLQKELEGLFTPEEAAEVVQALKNGNINNDNLQSLLYFDLAAVQPMSMLDMPKYYSLGGGVPKLMYQLKSFALRRANYLYTRTQEQFHNAKTPEEYAKALASAMYFFSLVVGYGAFTNLLKDFLLGRPLDVTEELVDTILQNAMFTRYMIKRAKQDPLMTLVNGIIPPIFGTANDLWQDAWKVVEGKKDVSQMNIWSRLPIFGKPYYWWFGGGKAITEKDNKEKGLFNLFKIKGWAGK